MNGRPGALLGANIGKLSWSCRQQSRSLGSRAPKIKASPNMYSIPDSENMVFGTGTCILGQLRHISLVCYWFPHQRSADDVRLAQTWQYCPLPSADWPSGNISKSGRSAEKRFVPLRQKKKHPVLTWEAGRIRRIFGEITSTVLAGGQHLKDRVPVSGFCRSPRPWHPSKTTFPLSQDLSVLSHSASALVLALVVSTCCSRWDFPSASPPRAGGAAPSPEEILDRQANAARSQGARATIPWENHRLGSWTHAH